MALGKRIMRMSLPRAFACNFIALYIRLVRLTGNWQDENRDIPEAMLAEGKPFLVAFWHGRLFMAAATWRFDYPFNMVISEHPDGQLISRTISYLGIKTIAGSTTRGGVTVFRKLIRAIQNGECAGITPDGPQGPRMRAAKGIIEAARLTGAPIVPMSWSCNSARLARSWDRLVIPLPFSRGVIRWEKPIEIPRELDEAGVEEATKKLEVFLNDLTATLDQRMDREPVLPAEPSPT